MSFPRFNLERFENSSGDERKKQSDELDKICSETGFLVIEGHGVSQRAIKTNGILFQNSFRRLSK